MQLNQNFTLKKNYLTGELFFNFLKGDVFIYALF